jgi:aminoglycoside/choline kinase family phosphotransferase
MDSSLQKESLLPFIDITTRLSSVGVSVPTIYYKDLEGGFLLLEDFGDTNLLDLLDEDSFKLYYKRAIDEIIKMQEVSVDNLPLYDREFLRFEMELMEEWYLNNYLGINIDKDIINTTIESILDIVLTQPQGVFVHRDFHSRNIMVKGDDSIGVIDYQDARVGAITYDLVSLLRDSYIEFGREDIEELVLYFRDEKALEIGDSEFIKWFEFMGLQRHIKILGIFARLSLRDGKDNYLDDIPQTLKYIVNIGMRYEESRELATILNSSYNQ